MVAWVVIVGVCVALPLLRSEEKAVAQASTQPVAPKSVDFQTELAGRMWVGLVHLSETDRKSVDSFVGMPAVTPVEKAARAIVLADLGEREKAITLLKSSSDPAAAELLDLYGASPTTSPSTVPSTSAASVRSGDKPATTTSSESLSKGFDERFGWYAQLAHVYGRPDTDPARAAVLNGARHTILVTATGFAIAILAGVVGFGLFVTAIVLLATGRVKSAVGRTGMAANIYIEAVAIYLSGFIVSSLAIGFLFPRAPLSIHILGLGAVVLLGMLWPLLRGVPWPTLRQDWGIHTGRGVLREMAAGIGGYLAGLPILVVGLTIMIVLILLTHDTPSHPIQQQVGDHSWVTVVSLYAIASVFAPLTEELMFRGALVSHLRGWMGPVCAALLSGLVFGAVHPQGWTVVPALASVGAVLALIRQWRGTLIASITAHAMHNAFLITIMTLATR
ncbi:MAG: amino terminal protease family protein [Phycisphaerales bacterium]|nr:amino terminal protease family protein [Phycisphaerales bacterium]